MRVHPSHPQLREVIVCKTAYGFTCPGCDEEYYVRGAHVQPDGTLRCSACSEKQTVPDRRGRFHTVSLYWCPQCRQAKPWQDCEKTWPRHRGRRCLDCATAEKTPQPVTRTCEHCGADFTPVRRDARYCSGRCRTAAHRAKR